MPATLAGSRNPAWCDYELGKRSRASLVALVSQGATIITPVGRDRYGRILERVSVNRQDAGVYLVSQGLARIWRTR